MVELRGADVVRRALAGHLAMAQALAAGDAPEAVERAAALIVESLRSGGKVIFFGNGGSAADAQHLAAELVGRYLVDRPPLPALALGDNTASLTAIGNDYSFDRAFARQVEAFGAPGDVAVALSTSGSSPNVLAAVEAARARGLRTIGVTGERGDRLAAACDHAIRIPSPHTPLVQEGSLLLCHVLCELVEASLFGG